MSQLKQLSKNFFCYLLTSLRPEFKNHTYIGFTNDPKHRIKQHNREIAGGARKTLKKLPWKMILAVSGFETDISALQFEWAWQRPRKSVFLKHLYPVKGVGKGQTFLKAKVRYLYLLVNTPPFLNMNLTIHWFVKQKPDPTNTAQTTEKNVVTTNKPLGDIVDYNLLKVGCIEFPRETFTELDNLYDSVCRSCKLTIIKGEVNPCELQLCPSKKQRRLAKASKEKTADEVKSEGSDVDKVQKRKRKIKVKVSQVKTKTKPKTTSKAKSVTESKTKSITKTKARTSKIARVDGEIKTKTAKTKTKTKTKTKMEVKEKGKRKSRTAPAKTDNEGITEITKPQPQRKPRKSATLKTKKSKDNS